MKSIVYSGRFGYIVTTLVIALALVAQAQANVVLLVDLGSNESYRGASVPSPDVNGNYWNSVWSGAFYPDIVDTNGNATPIDFGFSTATGTDYYNGPSGPVEDPAACIYDATALGMLGVNEAVYDYYVTSRFEIQGLDPSKTYNLTFYGAHQFNSDPTTLYSVYSDNTYSTMVDSVTLDIYEPGFPWIYNQDKVATISGLSPQTDNILYVDFRGTDGGDGYLNAFMIEEVVPEPSSLLLLGTCGLLCLLRRR